MEVSGIIVLLVAVIGARFLNERGYRMLTDEQKVRLMDGFSAQRVYSLIPIVVLIAGFFFLTSKTNIDRAWLSIAYFGLLVIYVVIKAVFNHWKMKSLEMPVTYRWHFLAAQSLSMLGLAWFLFSMLQQTAG